MQENEIFLDGEPKTIRRNAIIRAALMFLVGLGMLFNLHNSVIISLVTSSFFFIIALLFLLYWTRGKYGLRFVRLDNQKISWRNSDFIFSQIKQIAWDQVDQIEFQPPSAVIRLKSSSMPAVQIRLGEYKATKQLKELLGEYAAAKNVKLH